MKPTELYIGEWPPPEAIEHAGTGSADESWPPPDPDNLSDEADPDDGAWYAPILKPKARRQPPAEPIGPEWHEVTQPDAAEQVPQVAPEPAPTQSGPMQALQKVVDESTDDEVRRMRERGCDLMPKRWGGREPA